MGLRLAGVRGTEWCPWEGCTRLSSDDPRRFGEHIATEHQRCWCGRYVISVVGHIAQSRRWGLTHPDRPVVTGERTL